MILRLLTYNIRFGGLGREDRIADLIKSIDPDLVVFQEATIPGVIETLARKTNLPFWAAKRNHSIAFISRLKIDRYEWHLPARAKHSFLKIVPAQTDISVVGLHLSAVFSKWSERRRTHEIRMLLRSIDRLKEEFHLLVGDFNALAPGELLDVKRMPGWIRTLIWLSGRDIQRETIQTMLEGDYIDGYRSLHSADRGYTFPTWDPHLRLDYIFVPSAFAERLISCDVVTLPAAGGASDHFPILAEIETTDKAAETASVEAEMQQYQ